MTLTNRSTRVLLLGGYGLLGTALFDELSHHGADVARPCKEACDVRDLAALRRALADHEADLVINSAAFLKVADAEKNPKMNTEVNALGAHNVALAAADADVPLVHISTDFVFDGKTHRPYTEVDPTGDLPPNRYGRAKLWAEQLVRHCWRKHFIVRVAAIYGPAAPTFVDWAIQNADPQKPLTVVRDRFCSPTSSVELAHQIRVLAETPYFGTYHAAGRGLCTFFELACAAVELSGNDPAGIVPVTDDQLNESVRRAPYTALDNAALRHRGLEVLSPWRQALAAFVRRRYGGQP